MELSAGLAICVCGIEVEQSEYDDAISAFAEAKKRKVKNQ